MLDLDRLDTDPAYRAAGRNADDMRTAALDTARRVVNNINTTRFERDASRGQIGMVMVLLGKLRTHNRPVYDTAYEWWMARAETNGTGRVIGTSLKMNAVSDVITRLNGHLSAPGVATPAPAPAVDDWADITDGNYAVTDDAGKNHFYRVVRKTSKRTGAVYMRVQERASEELFNVTRIGHRNAILRSIRDAGVMESHMAYAKLLSRCWHCHTALTDNTGNPHFDRGLGPICGDKV